jgi:outer membrane lipoprotein-sorting protein
MHEHIFILLSILAILATLAAQCGAPAPTEAPAATAAPAGTAKAAATEAPATAVAPAAMEKAATTEAPAATKEDAKSIIAKSSANLKNLKSYRSKIAMEKDGQTTETLYEYILPDRFHLVSGSAEMIVIGQDMYMKAGDTWTKMPGGGAGAKLPEVGVKEEDILETRLEGGENVDGVPCQKYFYATKATDKTFEVTVWIGVEDGLPHKIVTKPEPGTTVTQTFYDFNADITIEAPETE